MLYVKEFPSRQELEWFLQGKILGEKVFEALKGINVRNQTLVFASPAVTITFPNTAAFESATPAEIQAEADSQSAGRLSLVKPPGGPSGNVRFAFLTNSDACTGGTALPTLGLITGTVGALAIALASVADVYYVEKSAQYGLVYDA